jgi:hypothetical protein
MTIEEVRKLTVKGAERRIIDATPQAKRELWFVRNGIKCSAERGCNSDTHTSSYPDAAEALARILRKEGYTVKVEFSKIYISW